MKIAFLTFTSLLALSTELLASVNGEGDQCSLVDESISPSGKCLEVMSPLMDAETLKCVQMILFVTSSY